MSTRPGQLVTVTSGGSLVVFGRFRQVHLSLTPIWCPSKAYGTHEAGGNVAESLMGCRISRKRVAAHTVGNARFGEDGG